MKVKKSANALLAVQRKAALRIKSAYRTVSIELAVMERSRTRHLKQACTLQLAGTTNIKEETTILWQERWPPKHLRKVDGKTYTRHREMGQQIH